MDYRILAALIQTHPQWPSVADSDLAAWCNEEIISATKTTLPNEAILAVLLSNRAEFAALSDTDKQIVRDILYVGDSVPTAAGEPARDTLVDIFGVQSGTIQSLAEAINYQISRAADAGVLGTVSADDVAFARMKI